MLALVSGLVLTFSAQNNTLPNAKYLYQSCESLVRVGRSDERQSDPINAPFCLGYIVGWGTPDNPWSKCVDGLPLGTIARSYVRFMNKKPEYLDVSIDMGFTQAMVETYLPCQKTSKK